MTDEASECVLSICDGSQIVPGPTLEDSDRPCPCAIDGDLDGLDRDELSGL